MQAFARMTIPIRRVWTGVATRIGVRKRGHLKLGKDVSSCEYEDVRVMWEMLSRNHSDWVPEKKKLQEENTVGLLGMGKASSFSLSKLLKKQFDGHRQ